MSERDDYFISKPTEVKISITNSCNYRCIMCANPDLKGESGLIEDSLFYKILDECVEFGIPRIAVGAIGDPLVNKKYVSYLKAAKERGLEVSTTTNASLLDREKADEIVAIGFNRFSLSLYSASSEEHRAYTGTDAFEQTERNVRYFVQAWDRNGRHGDVRFSFLELPDINDYQRFTDYWGPFFGKYDIPIPKKPFYNYSEYSARIYAGAGRRSVRQVHCPHIRYYIAIHHNGDVVPCTHIFEVADSQNIRLGDLNRQTIMEVWESKRFRAIKENHFAKKISQYKPCRNCTEAFLPCPTFLQKVSHKTKQHSNRLMNAIMGARQSQ